LACRSPALSLTPTQPIAGRFFMSDKLKKPQKLRARQPRGFVDRSPDDIRATDKMVADIRKVFERYGFDPLETPMFEYTDALGKFLPDQDRPNEGVFSLQDDDEQWMSLRYDLTAPLARHVAENINDIQLPFRTYRQGWVFRNEKPGPGRFRQFMQFDADTVGAPGVQADAEMCMMMADTMEALGIKRGDYVIRVNNRKVLDGVMEAIGVADPGQKLTVLRAIDKLDKFGVEGVRLLLGAGRWSDGLEKGDFTKGAGLGAEASNKLVQLFTHPIDRPADYFMAMDSADSLEDDALLQGSMDIRPLVIANPRFLDVYEAQFPDSPLFLEGLQELRQISDMVRSAGYGTKRIRITPSIVRGLEYYTGPVYEAELLTKVPNEKGEIVQFGSVGGGGRYDGLVKRFTGQDVPATGFSIGVSRLMTALKNLGKLDVSDVGAPVLVTVMENKSAEALGRYLRFTQELRNSKNEKGEHDIRAEMYQGNPKEFPKQLRYANRRGCPIAVIQGEDERKAEGGPVVIIKDMIEGMQIAEGMADNSELRKARVAQVIVPEAALVETVRKMLAAQKAAR
jgi:histidyl-tRNA synthetase